MAVNIPSQWDLIYMFWFQRVRRFGLFVFCKNEYNGMQIYLAATENWFVDLPTAD